MDDTLGTPRMALVYLSRLAGARGAPALSLGHFPTIIGAHRFDDLVSKSGDQN